MLGNLSDAEKERFYTTGFLFKRGLFADLAEELKSWATELSAMPESLVWHYSEASSVSPFTRIRCRTENFIDASEPFRRLLMSEKLTRILANLLDDEPVVFKDKMNYKLRGNPGFEPHQDSQAGWEQYADYFVSVGIAIDEQLARGGCLEFIPDNFSRKLIGKLWSPLTTQQVDFARFEPYPCQPGDVIFFDSYVPHRSKPNLTVESQRILYVTFNGRKAGDFRKNYYEDKFRNFPPDFYRDPGKTYSYKV